MSSYKLSYFNARGLAENIRILFFLANVPYEGTENNNSIMNIIVKLTSTVIFMFLYIIFLALL